MHCITHLSAFPARACFLFPPGGSSNNSFPTVPGRWQRQRGRRRGKKALVQSTRLTDLRPQTLQASKATTNEPTHRVPCHAMHTCNSHAIAASFPRLRSNRLQRCGQTIKHLFRTSLFFPSRSLYVRVCAWPAWPSKRCMCAIVDALMR